MENYLLYLQFIRESIIEEAAIFQTKMKLQISTVKELCSNYIIIFKLIIMHNRCMAQKLGQI